jgi:hypothetical protein
MKVMVLVKANDDSEAGRDPAPELYEEMGKFNEELIAAGVLVDGGGLERSSEGKRVLFSGGEGDERSVVDGPFAETKELVAGYWIWEVASMDEAIEWMRKCPNPHAEEGIVEIRPIAARIADMA